jgi:hypothetical protein
MIATPEFVHIAEPLRHRAVPIASLVPDVANARRHDEKNIARHQGRRSPAGASARRRKRRTTASESG